MIRAYLTKSHSRLRREDTWWWADTAQCHGAPATPDSSRTAVHKGFYLARIVREQCSRIMRASTPRSAVGPPPCIWAFLSSLSESVFFRSW